MILKLKRLQCDHYFKTITSSMKKKRDNNKTNFRLQ